MKSAEEHLQACRRLLRTTQQQLAAAELKIKQYECKTCSTGQVTGWQCPDCGKPLMGAKK